MSGLEKIISSIKEVADNESQQILKDAHDKEQVIIAAAEKEASEIKKAAEDKASKESVLIRERSDSTSILRRQQLMLLKKQELIQETIELARKKLADMPDTEYFAALEKIAETHILPEAGTMYLSDKDLKRMPADFKTKIEAAAKAKGGSLTISDETRKLDGGFVLQYGGVDENCSFEAMFNTEMEDLQDIAMKTLFS